MPVYDAYDFLSLVISRQDIIAEGILPLESKMVLGGQSFLGKTKLITQIALEIASGTPALGLFNIDRPYKTLLIQQELGEGAFHDRFVPAMGTIYNLQPGFLTIVNVFNLQVDDANGRANLTRLLQAFHPEVLIFDPLYKIHTQDEDKASQMQRVFNILDDIIRDFHLSVIIVHHRKKAHIDPRGREIDLGLSDLRGSGQISIWADSVLMLSKHPASKTDELILSFDLRHGQVDPVILTPIDNTFTFSARPQGQPTGADEQAIISILNATSRGVADYQSLLAGVKAKTLHSESYIRRALSSLKKKALIAEAGQGRSKRQIFLLAPPRDQWFLLDSGK
jgi:hypothetical protein